MGAISHFGGWMMLGLRVWAQIHLRFLEPSYWGPLIQVIAFKPLILETTDSGNGFQTPWSIPSTSLRWGSSSGRDFQLSPSFVGQNLVTWLLAAAKPSGKVST